MKRPLHATQALQEHLSYNLSENKNLVVSHSQLGGCSYATNPVAIARLKLNARLD